MKQEKLCEIEDMLPEEMGAENVRIMMDTMGMGLMSAEQTVKTKPKPTANTRQIGGQHYKKMDIQPWDVIDYGPKQQAIGFYRYNALKYIMRAGEKGDFKEDIAKAQHYLEKLLEILE